MEHQSQNDKRKRIRDYFLTPEPIKPTPIEFNIIWLVIGGLFLILGIWGGEKILILAALLVIGYQIKRFYDIKTRNKRAQELYERAKKHYDFLPILRRPVGG